MTSIFLNFFENLSLSFFYKGLSQHQIWFNLDQGNKVTEGSFPQVDNVLNPPDEIGLRLSETKKIENSVSDNTFFVYLIMIKLCTLKQLENIHQKLKVKFS